MKILSIEEIGEADTIRKHVEAGGTVNADGTLEQPATESQVAAVEDALKRPAVVVNVAATGLAAEMQLKGQALDEEIATLEHSIEAMTAQLTDKVRARAMVTMGLREYHRPS